MIIRRYSRTDDYLTAAGGVREDREQRGGVSVRSLSCSVDSHDT